jgi:hypothetical protein
MLTFGGEIVGRSWGACICYGNFCGLESQVQVASQVSGTGFLGMSRSMEFACISRTGRCRGWLVWRGGTTFFILSAYICLHIPVACVLPFGCSLAPLELRLGQSFPVGLDYVR